MRRVALAGLSVLALAAALQLWVRREQTRLAGPPPGFSSCRACHTGVEGVEPSHRFGCEGCHLGSPQETEADEAHLGLVRIPGQLADVGMTCGTASCHPSAPARLRANIMATMNGVVSVDRWVFGEQPTPTALTPVQSLGDSPADRHLKGLCVSCHLGTLRTEVGPLDEETRGGGCSACHLTYSARAAAAVGGWKKGAAEPWVHPALSARPEPVACFGCHARSGRISLNYQGWREGRPDGGAVRSRELADGRLVWAAPPDVHFERGLQCVDCHGSWEVMGTGARALHREDQATVRCDDCHRRGPGPTASLAELDPESARVAVLERLDGPGRRYLLQARGGAPLVGAYADDAGRWVQARYTGARLPLKPPAAACARGTAHRALGCPACHDAWAPRCVSCHTEHRPDAGGWDHLLKAEVPGAWEETGGEPGALPATLGVREAADGGRRVVEVAPGMVLTLVQGPGQPASFHRLFAPVSPHTVRREARDCQGCHRDPVALGYGQGALRFDGGAVAFEPALPPRPEDGLPADAWLGFLGQRGPGAATREDTRPFSQAEQRRILTVGACLECHPGESPVMQRGLEDFARVLARRSPRCRLPRLP